MNIKLTLTIKKRTQAEWLMQLVVVLPFLFGTLNDLLGLPWAIRYILDGAWALLLVMICLNKVRQNKKGISLLMLWAILFFSYTLLVYIVQYQSFPYYLWGVRNNFRFFVVFFAFTTFLSERDITNCFKLFDVLFWANVAVSIVQFFALNYNGDYLGGIFGTEQGCNGYTNIFFVIVLTKDILFYLENKVKLPTCFLKCAAALWVAALAELKFFFVEFVIIIAFVSAFTKFSWRKLWVILGGAVGAFAFAALLSALFPNFANFFSFKFFFETGTSNDGYTGAGDLNRLDAITKINEMWLKTPWQRLFGLGLGNCDTSGFEIVNTPFYETYGDMHYTWLSYAFMYLECGWIGLMFYFGFFVLVYFAIRKIEKRSEGIAKTYCRMGRILAILCMIIAIYNASLRTEAGYMMFFALAVPFAMDRQEIRRKS